MSKIFHPEDYRVYRDNGNSYTAAYLGTLYNLKPLKLEWKIDKKNAEFTGTSGEYLTLKDISDQAEKITSVRCWGKSVTVFFITKNTNSFIYKYENMRWYMYDTNFNMNGGIDV